jgi:superfamily II DNA or RNA helicase
MDLRDYQVAAVDGIRGGLKQADRVFLSLPTGGGKTVIFCHIAQNAIKKGNKVLILVHRKELILQASTALMFLGVSHGIIANGFKGNDEPVQVASVQTLVRRLGKVDFDPALIIIDEAHHAVAGSWAKILNHFSKAKLLGVSATPQRLDKKGLDEYFDLLVQGPQVKELINRGFLSPVKCFTLPTVFRRDLIAHKNGEFDLQEAMEEQRAFKIEGDAIKEYKKHCPGKPAVVFCCTIEHAEFVAEAFSKAGYRSACLTSNTTAENRASYIEKLGNGGLDILTSCNVISEGTDIPVVTCGILMRPTESLSLYLQQVGRVLRTAEGKKHAIIIDCVGNVQSHGLPQMVRQWSLEAPPKKQAAAPVKICPECFACLPINEKTCPLCGHEFSAGSAETEYLEVKRSDLVEVEESGVLSRAEKQDRKRRISDAGDDHQKLEALRREFGYKPGWVWQQQRRVRQNRNEYQKWKDDNWAFG